MAEQQIRFDDGAGYERMMGKWSQLVGATFLDWLALPPGLRWVDVGCGNGAFTEMLVERCAPAGVSGIDPSEGQIAYARNRPGLQPAQFQLGDAMALPYGAAAFDAAVMALVIFFVPAPARGVSEMVRVTRPGGTVAAYAWDILGGGFPLDALQDEIRRIGVTPPLPPSAPASRLDALPKLWAEAGLVAIETREIAVERSFEGFDDFWSSSLLGAGIGPLVAALPADDAALLKSRLQARLPAAAGGRLTLSARANAVKGRVPG